jgi:hypothetical protein
MQELVEDLYKRTYTKYTSLMYLTKINGNSSPRSHFATFEQPLETLPILPCAVNGCLVLNLMPQIV